MGSIKGQKHNPYIEGKYGHLNPNDVVFTPDWLAKQIVDMFPIEGNSIADCAAGKQKTAYGYKWKYK